MGNAACAAAYAARQAGASVLVLEKAPEQKKGGNSWFSASAQFRHVHNGLEDERRLIPRVSRFELARTSLVPYTADDFYNDLMRASRGRADPQLAELLVTESYDALRWMAEAGIAFTILYPSFQVRGQYRWSHGQNFIHARECGKEMIATWYEILQRAGVEVLFDAPAVGLSVDATGRVSGVMAETPGGVREIRAGAAVLACGGFEASPALRAQWLGPGWDLAKVRGTKYNTGDGIQAALNIGAQALGHYSYAHAAPIDASAGEVEAGFLDPAHRKFRTHRYAWNLGIMVHGEGRRFLDEGEDFHGYTYAKFGGIILQQPGGIAHQIFDAKTTPLVLAGDMYTGATPTTGNTLAELAENLDLNVETFVSTVEEFNNACPPGDDVDYVVRDGRATKGLRPPKTNWARRIDTPPFTSFAAACGITFTYGGLKVNPRMQVLDKRDKPIKGLYGCGELTGGFFFHNYPSGSGFMRGAVTGRVSGRNGATD